MDLKEVMAHTHGFSKGFMGYAKLGQLLDLPNDKTEHSKDGLVEIMCEIGKINPVSNADGFKKDYWLYMSNSDYNLGVDVNTISKSIDITVTNGDLNFIVKMTHPFGSYGPETVVVSALLTMRYLLDKHPDMNKNIPGNIIYDGKIII